MCFVLYKVYGEKDAGVGGGVGEVFEYKGRKG